MRNFDFKYIHIDTHNYCTFLSDYYDSIAR